MNCMACEHTIINFIIFLNCSEFLEWFKKLMKISFEILKVIKLKRCKNCIYSYWNKIQKNEMCGKHNKTVVMSEDSCNDFDHTNWK